MEAEVQQIYNRINVGHRDIAATERRFVLLCEHCICPAILLGSFYNYSSETAEYSPLGPYCDTAIYNTLEGISDWYLGLFGLSDIKWAIEYLVYKDYITVDNVAIDKLRLLKIDTNIERINDESRDLKVEPQLIHDPKYALLKAREEVESRRRRKEQKEANVSAQKEVPQKSKINPTEEEEKRVRLQNKRAQRVRLLATLTLEQWLETLNHFGWKCAYCKGRYVVLEHFIPIIHGGGTTWDNCVPACPRCNAIKMSWNPLADWGPDFTGIKDGIEIVRDYLETRKQRIA